MYYTTKRLILKREIITALSQSYDIIHCRMSFLRAPAGRNEGAVPHDEKKTAREPAYLSAQEQRRCADKPLLTRRIRCTVLFFHNQEFRFNISGAFIDQVCHER
jgi:hypothetical protein